MLKERLKDQGINMLDIGSSGDLDAQWEPLKKVINFVGFDPNKDECVRQEQKQSVNYRSAKFLPYALGDKDGKDNLYLTESIYCYSLLEPNSQWLSRFSFKDLFKVRGVEKIDVRKLTSIEEIKSVKFDIVKIDVQGLELPVMESSGNLLDDVFFIETENGFVDNYKKETTFHQMSKYLTEKSFIMFGLNTNHKIARNNRYKDLQTGKEQILWAESTWLKDYIQLDQKGEFDDLSFDTVKAYKVLLICSFYGCIDYGYELAEFFYHKGLLDKEVIEYLKLEANWQLAKGNSQPSVQSLNETSLIRKSGFFYKIRNSLLRPIYRSILKR